MDGKTHFEIVQSQIMPEINSERRHQEELEYTRKLGKFTSNTNGLINNVLSRLEKLSQGKQTFDDAHSIFTAVDNEILDITWFGGTDKTSREVDHRSRSAKEMRDIERRYIVIKHRFDFPVSKIELKVNIPDNCYLQRTLILGTHDVSYRTPGIPVSPEKHFNENIEILSGFSLVGENEAAQLMLDNSAIPDPFKADGFISEKLKPSTNQALSVFRNDSFDRTHVTQSDFSIYPVAYSTRFETLAEMSKSLEEVQFAFETFEE